MQHRVMIDRVCLSLYTTVHACSEILLSDHLRIWGDHSPLLKGHLYKVVWITSNQRIIEILLRGVIWKSVSISWPWQTRSVDACWVTSAVSGRWRLTNVYYCPACRTTLVATRFRVAVICPIIQVPHCIRVFFYFVWFVFINHIFQFYNELCTYCNILDIYLS